MSNQVTALTPEVLQKVAERLGYVSIEWDEGGCWLALQDGGGYEIWRHGDLLLRVLNKAAEMGYARETFRSGEHINVTFAKGFDHYRAQVGSDNELEAAMHAFAQLPLEGGNG